MTKSSICLTLTSQKISQVFPRLKTLIMKKKLITNNLLKELKTCTPKKINKKFNETLDSCIRYNKVKRSYTNLNKNTGSHTKTPHQKTTTTTTNRR